jgi:hypothetical protein
MSENKWTPGPWRVKGAAGGTAIVLARSGAPAIVNTRANAHLIAAAPDLARIVEIFLNGDERFQVAVGGNPIALERLFADAHAALAKARGEA